MALKGRIGKVVGQKDGSNKISSGKGGVIAQYRKAGIVRAADRK
ncbi:MAG: hypothetical protein WC254_02230 [Candidatus Woesearchaeota archaeon]|jgi:hypothetical protein